MGRQIQFFMIRTEELKFLELVENEGDMIVDDKGNAIDILEFKETLIHKKEKTGMMIISSKFFIAFKESQFIKDENGFINPLRSDVIEFSRCSEKSGNILRQGRIWAEFSYYDDNDVLVKKDKWFEQKFNKYRNWIKKNFRISTDKSYYIGEEAYKLYKEKGYKMMAGPKVEIKF